MSACKLLTGENIAPRSTPAAKALIGVRVTYLRGQDIDKSGRGYFFPKHGVISAVVRGNVAFDDPMNFVCTLKDIVEMVRQDD